MKPKEQHISTVSKSCPNFYIICVWLPLYEQFQNTKNKNKKKKNCLEDHIYFWDFFFIQKVTYRIYRLLFFEDNDKEIELMYPFFFFFLFFFILISFKFKVWEFFYDKNKLLNLRYRRLWTNIWSPLFLIYLQLCNLKNIYMFLENE